jgi:uncharacterized protein (DUF1800 family)
MILNRRLFNTASLALLLDAPFNFTAAKASPPALGVIALNRLSFGATHDSAAYISKIGLENWLDQELAKPATDARLETRLLSAKLMFEYEAGEGDHGSKWPARKELVSYQFMRVTGDKLLPLLDFDKHPMSYEERIRPAREVQAASLTRAVHADAQLREVMTQFWHDHFNVNSMRDEHTAAYFGIYDTMLRENAIGNFRKMLGEVTRSPSMLFYLNNEASKASPANENFARELFELHTLGAGNYFNDRTTEWHDVPGAKLGLAQGYIDQDVYEAARALTGWSFGDGRYIAEGDNAPMSGAFHYIDRWHDPYQKRILAVEFRANAGPMSDGEKLLDVLAHHPGTARFLCTKICRRLVADEPSAALIETAMKVWSSNIDADDQIAKVIRAIVLAPEFLQTPPRKIKRPFEFLASLYRAADAEISPTGLGFIWELSKAGWNQHEFRPPTGHPDVAEYWANTNLISGFVSMALNAFEDWNEAGKTHLEKALPDGNKRAGDAAQFWLSRVLSLDHSPADAEVILDHIGIAYDAELPADLKEREYFLRGIVAAAALTPEFLFR